MLTPEEEAGGGSVSPPFRRLIAEDRAGARWRRLVPRTRKDYERVLEWADATFGALPPSKMERRHIIGAQAENSERKR